MVSPVAHRSCFKTGGGERARTVDLRLAKPALSQLSYTPVQMTDIRYQISEAAPGPAGKPQTVDPGGSDL
jgi:hypothetical protein